MNLICVMPLGRCKCGIHALHLLITFWDSQRCCLANVRARIRRAFFDGQNDDTPNHRHPYPTQHAQCHCPDQWVAVRQVLLKGIDREKREVRFLFCIAKEVYVHELANFEVLGSDVLNDLGKVFRHVAVFRYELWYDELEDVIEQSLVGTDRYESLHCIEFFPVAVRVELLPDIEKLGLVICIEVGNAAADNSQVPCML